MSAHLGETMPGVRLKDGDSVERALKALKKQVEKAGTISELKKRQHYEKPSIKRKKKQAAARKRLMKQLRKLGLA
jgi:small subunit ribosomal protein S21